MDIKIDEDWQQLLVELQEPDLFSSKKILEIRPIAALTKSIKHISKALSYQTNNIVIIFIFNDLTSSELKSTFMNDFMKEGEVLAAKTIPHYKWYEWVSSRLSAFNFTVDSKLEELLRDSYAGNTVALENTLKNLKQSFGNKTNLSYDECKSFVNHSASGNIFALIDSILGKNKISILNHIHNISSKDASILLLNGQIHKLTKCLAEISSLPPKSSHKDKEDITSKYSVPSFKSIKYQQLARIHSVQELSNIFSLLNIINTNVKTNNIINTWHLVTKVCLELAGFKFDLFEEENVYG